jgi:transcriptional regulator with XRE-family HTH domain
VSKIRDEKLLIKFGNRLRKIRDDKNLSQQELADYSDIPKNQIGRIERGEINPSLSTMNSIANALELKLSQLLDGI